MRTPETIQKKLLTMAVFLPLVSFAVIQYACNTQQSRSIALEAYDLRLEGDADSAGVILESYLTEHPDNAPACFELGRTLKHLGLGSQAFINGDTLDATYALTKAVELDPEKAEQYAKELKEADIAFGGKAREILMSLDANYVAFWKTLINANPDNADLHQSLGSIYLFTDHYGNGKAEYEKAMSLDPVKTIVLANLAPYKLMTLPQDESEREQGLPVIENLLNQYLETDPINANKAFAYQYLAFANQQQGKQVKADEYFKLAAASDPNIGRAFAPPSMILFTPPDEVTYVFRYFSRPF